MRENGEGQEQKTNNKEREMEQGKEVDLLEMPAVQKAGSVAVGALSGVALGPFLGGVGALVAVGLPFAGVAITGMEALAAAAGAESEKAKAAWRKAGWVVGIASGAAAIAAGSMLAPAAMACAAIGGMALAGAAVSIGATASSLRRKGLLQEGGFARKAERGVERAGEILEKGVKIMLGIEGETKEPESMSDPDPAPARRRSFGM